MNQIIIIIMKLKNIIVAVATIVLSAALGSCTVSEPEMPTGSASTMRLKSTTFLGANLMKVKYDNYNRITQIDLTREEVINFKYEGTSKFPVEVEVSDYEEVYVGNDSYENKLSIHDRWTNITNNGNYITGYNCHSVFYNYDVDYDPITEKETLKVSETRESTTELFSYNSDGYLVSYTTEHPEVGNTVVIYNWENGLLTEYYDNDDDHPERAICDYSDVDNINLQWDPNLEILGPIAITNLFGKAPKKFFKRIVSYNGGTLSSDIQYSYSLLPNGLINHERLFYAEDGGEYVTLNFVYESTK